MIQRLGGLLAGAVSRWRPLWLLLVAPMALALSADMDSPRQPAASPEHEFQLVRLAYSEARGFGFRRRSWLTDSPEAEVHFMDGVRRLARLDNSAYSVALAPMDERIFDYPFLYAVEVGHWSLSDAEAQHLREYLLRGGFLVVDDFWGTQEWEVFFDSLHRIFPDRQVVDLAADHPIFHVLYDVTERPQIPGIRGAITGQTWEKDGYVPHWRGVLDDEGRVMIAIHFNMDMGDAWEHADNPQYPATLTLLAYRYGIDEILYAMTH